MRIPNVGSKVRESAKAMSFAFILLDSQHAGIRIKVFIKRKIVSLETILSARTRARTHARTHRHQHRDNRTHEHTDCTKLTLHTT